MKNIDHLLTKQQYNFSSDFSSTVLCAIQAVKDHSPAAKWFVLGAVASVGLCIVSTYLLEGQLSIDTFLGTEGLYNDTLIEYNDTP
jgi:hypothetical protein|tara:strand:+ start:184 stop:441 length:258 start_codon:yes stop_codon:yes gene_type:complete